MSSFNSLKKSISNIMGVGEVVPRMRPTDRFKLIELELVSDERWEAFQWHEASDGSGEWRQLAATAWGDCDVFIPASRGCAEYAVKCARDELQPPKPPGVKTEILL